MKTTSKILLLALMMGTLSNAQEMTKKEKKVLNWYNGTKYGMSTDKAYKKLLKGRKSETVVIGVIDSGVDIEHKDLKNIIWVNKGEIAGNGIDDDKNGYIDDVHGWNFLGNANGKNANDAQLEVTRTLGRLNKKFKGRELKDICGEEFVDYTKYLEVKAEVESNLTNAQQGKIGFSRYSKSLMEADKKMQDAYGKDYGKKDIKKALKDPKMARTAKAVLALKKNGKENGLDESKIEDYMHYYDSQVASYYNVSFNEDAKIIGDNRSDISDVNYGNNDVEGPDAMHGTHCAGISAALRGNGYGNDGVADNAVIMSIRTIPNGDERDKDVALAIRYAVDNGAQVVNMSYGKSYGENDEAVIDAIRYAEKKGVLLVHAAGNDAADVDVEPRYPTSQYASMSEQFSNWLDVGASTRYKKKLAASFSNYGDVMVDVFAPGLEIYSTVPQSDFKILKGTSMAAPMVTGVAALLKSYFPHFTMLEIKDIIKQSVQTFDDLETPLPGSEKNMVKFSSLSETGGIVNVYNAVKLAIEKTEAMN